jgi:hypothetical protein
VACEGAVPVDPVSCSRGTTEIQPAAVGGGGGVEKAEVGRGGGNLFPYGENLLADVTLPKHQAGVPTPPKMRSLSLSVTRGKNPQFPCPEKKSPAGQKPAGKNS